MRVGKDFLKALDSAPVGVEAARGAFPKGQAAVFAAAVRKACPSLWARAQNSRLSRKEQHARLVQLLEWLAGKHGARVVANANRSYETETRRVDGRVDLRVVMPDATSVEVEVCLSPSEASVRKLFAAHKDGAHALLVCGFAGTIDEALSRLQKTVPLRYWGWVTLALAAPARPAPAADALTRDQR